MGETVERIQKILILMNFFDIYSGKRRQQLYSCRILVLCAIGQRRKTIISLRHNHGMSCYRFIRLAPMYFFFNHVVLRTSKRSAEYKKQPGGMGQVPPSPLMFFIFYSPTDLIILQPSCVIQRHSLSDSPPPCRGPKLIIDLGLLWPNHGCRIILEQFLAHPNTEIGPPPSKSGSEESRSNQRRRNLCKSVLSQRE